MIKECDCFRTRGHLDNGRPKSGQRCTSHTFFASGEKKEARMAWRPVTPPSRVKLFQGGIMKL